MCTSRLRKLLCSESRKLPANLSVASCAPAHKNGRPSTPLGGGGASMFENIIKDPRVRREIEAAKLKPILEALEAKLRSEGYSEATVSFYDQAAVHFAYWAARRHVDPLQINEAHFANFLSRHLSTCRCPFGGVRQEHIVRAALRHFEAALRSGDHVTSNREGNPTALEIEIQRFDQYLREASGLQEATRAYRRRYVREFLQAFFSDEAVDMSRLVPKNIVGYLSKRAALFKPASVKVLVSSLRSSVRFLRLHGECAEALPLAVPSPASWRLASLPRVLTDAEVRCLLAVFDRATAAGRRDYAITRCLTDLGLRAEEVARLRLDDINWRKAIVRIAGTKSRRDDLLPLTNRVLHPSRASPDNRTPGLSSCSGAHRPKCDAEDSVQRDPQSSRSRRAGGRRHRNPDSATYHGHSYAASRSVHQGNCRRAPSPVAGYHHNLYQG